MADVNVYIDTDVAGPGTGSTGDPYDSLVTAWEARDQDIDPGDNYIFHCEGLAEDVMPTSTGLLFDDWPTAGAGDCTITIQPWAGKSQARYTGDLNYSTSHYRIAQNHGFQNIPCISIATGFESGDSRIFTVEGIQLTNTSNSSGQRLIDIIGTPANTIVVKNCRLKPDNTIGPFPRGIRADNSITTDCELQVIQNLLAWQDADSGQDLNMSFININDTLVTTKAYNNTVAYYNNTGHGEDVYDDVANSPAATFVNNVIYSANATSSEIDWQTNAPTLKHNATKTAADRPTTGDIGWDIATGDFTSFGTDDGDNLTPNEGSQTNAWADTGSAITNADDALVPTTDIRGNARNTTAGTNTAAGCFANSDEGGAGPTFKPRIMIY